MALVVVDVEKKMLVYFSWSYHGDMTAELAHALIHELNIYWLSAYYVFSIMLVQGLVMKQTWSMSLASLWSGLEGWQEAFSFSSQWQMSW